jgi:hypothetical protein
VLAAAKDAERRRRLRMQGIIGGCRRRAPPKTASVWAERTMGSKDLDFGFGFLPVLSEMGEIREFRCFSVKFSDKIIPKCKFSKKYLQNSPNSVDFGW